MKYSLETYNLFFGSLSNPKRLQIINALKKGKKCVGEICKETNLEQTLVSHNLKRLERCGMVFAEQQGKFRYYSLNKATIKPLLDLIEKHMGKYCAHITGDCHE